MTNAQLIQTNRNGLLPQQYTLKSVATVQVISCPREISRTGAGRIAGGGGIGRLKGARSARQLRQSRKLTTVRYYKELMAEYPNAKV
jgi:ribosomal protein L19E